MLSNILDIYLENVLLVLDVLDLLESDDVVDREDLEGEVIAAVPLPAQTHAGERACKQKLYKSVDINMCRGEKRSHHLPGITHSSLKYELSSAPPGMKQPSLAAESLLLSLGNSICDFVGAAAALPHQPTPAQQPSSPLQPRRT